MSKDYERWKKGKKVFKAPWIIKYWQNITDENQYEWAKKVETRAILIIGIFCFILGFLFATIIFT